MLLLQPLSADSGLMEYSLDLLESAFPDDERRCRGKQIECMLNNKLMNCNAIMLDGKAVGILNYWTLNGIRYIEHFAINPDLRGSGIGGDIIRRFINDNDMPVILEVELPTNDISRRRIAFYQRAGLSLWHDVAYEQPSYHGDDKRLPMHLMATPSLSINHADKIIHDIHTYVYGIQPATT